MAKRGIKLIPDKRSEAAKAAALLGAHEAPQPPSATIDFESVLPPKKRPQGRPRSLKPPSLRKKRKQSYINNIYIEHQNVDMPSSFDIIDINEINSVELKGPLAPREIKCLESLFSQTKPYLDYAQAAKNAGFKAKYRQSLEIIAKRIVEKYCAASADHKKIFRQVGASEVYLAQTLKTIIDNTKLAPSARVNALAILSKILGLQREVIEGLAGARVIFKSRSEQKPKVIDDTKGLGAGTRPAAGQGQAIKPIQIVK